MNILIIGCGYLGQTVAASLVNQESVYFTKTKSPDSTKSLFFTILKPSSYSKLPQIIKDMDVIIVTASAGSKKTYSESYLLLARSLKKALDPYKNKTVIYASSTGVYAESQGSICSEESPLDHERAHILIDTEKTYLSIKENRVVIFRFSGLYGDLRPLKRLYQSYMSQPLFEKDVNFVHIKQAAHAIIFAIYHPIRGIYNVSAFTIKNTTLFETLFKTPAPMITHDLRFSKHGGGKKISSKKLLGEPGFFFKEYALD